MLFKIITFSLSNVMVASTFWLVIFVLSNVMVAFGVTLSIQSTFAIAVPVFPAWSTYSNVNSPFSSKV